MELKHAKLIVNHPPERHALASPSKLEALTLCPYMAKNCQGRKEEPSEAAIRGRKLHEAVVNDEIYETLSIADKAEVDYLREDILAFDVEGYTVEFEVFVEIREDYGVPGDPRELISFGTLDIVIHKDDWTEALVIDNKTGKWLVKEAKDNRQLHAYAVGLFQTHPELQRLGLQVKQFAHKGENDAIASYTRDDYWGLTKVLDIIERANEAEESDARPGTDACKFCWKENCKAYMEAVRKGMSLTEFEIPDLPLPAKAKVCDEFLMQASAAQEFLDNATGKAKEVILENGGSEHFSVVYGKTSKVVDWKGACEEAGVGEDIIAKHTTEKTTKSYVAKKKYKKGEGCS